ncbi:MAG: hypothetical protein H0Z38_01700 [Firmicutes bacterium]|nr:hypothetical protein [Bacillota bacterium]
MRQEILQLLTTPEEREVAGHVLDLVERVKERGSVETSWFLALAEQDLVSQIMRRFPDLEHIFLGGFPKAERKRLVLGPQYSDLQSHGEIGAVRIEVKTGPEGEISHRDLLGAVLGLGLNRRYLGDVVVTETGGELVAANYLVPEIVRGLVSVSRYPARAERIPLEELSVGLERKKLVKATVPSLRLDAVAAAGFGKSRSVMAREIKAMRIRVNGSPAKSPSQSVGQGDMISVHGKGRIVIAKVGGQTKKGRTVLEIERYY